MSIQHLNDVKAIARAAKRIGAPLPERTKHALAHLDDIVANRPAAPQPGAAARELAQHIGNPVAMDKALKASAVALASADAAAKIHAHLAETCGSKVRGMMRAQSEQIAAAFGAALKDDLATLSRTAGKLPAWFRVEQAADLDPDTFAAWTQARDAYDRITSTHAALSPLYAGAIDAADGIHFPDAAARALRFANPPKLSTPREAYAFRDALAGRTERPQTLAGQGSVFVDGMFAPTLLAQLGATFEWATPAEVADRVRVVTTGMTERDRVSA
ncbi:hypothetical protein [Nocardioides sp. URHA0032]|uniref:hypothetical protein n=1 Tax=Nocardioides sp. URHA0032 TaxID=1380388 RepID=UPI00048F3654|nr:hypothetical protein [Nocardioides sp. URHA0032]